MLTCIIKKKRWKVTKVDNAVGVNIGFKSISVVLKSLFRMLLTL